MKKIFVLLAVFLIISCQEDEIKYSNAAWSGANGIVKPDTVAKVIDFNTNNYDAIIKSKVTYPSYPDIDNDKAKLIFEGYFKSGNAFTNIEKFKVNGNNVDYYKSSFYPSYFYSQNDPLTFGSNNVIEVTDNNAISSFEFVNEDVLGEVEISDNSLNDEIKFMFNKSWDIYSIDGYYIYYKQNSNSIESYYSINGLLNILTPDNLTIRKTDIAQIAETNLGISPEIITKVSISLLATDTSEVKIGNRNALIYKTAEKIYTFKYNQN